MKRKGFTMLEILIVIIIIAILATFAIPQYLKASRRAIASEAVTSIGALRGALARYLQEYNQLTAVIADLDIDNPNPITGTCPIGEVSADGTANSNFCYSIAIAENGTDYIITAKGETANGRASGLGVTYTSSTNKINIDYP